jgi:O-antigen/teichoic acid export membrane protein
MKRMFRGFAVLASSSVLTQLIAFAALAITARRVGPTNLGAYAVALSLVTFLSLPISYGLTNVGLREVAQRSDRVRDVTGEVFVLQLILASTGYLLLIALGPVLAPSDAMKRLLPVVGLFLFTGTSFEWALQALRRMRLIAAARIVGQVAFGALVPILVVGGFEGALRYAWLMVGGLALKHLVTTVFLIRSAGLPRLRVGPERLWRRFKASIAMGYATVMMQIYGQMDLLMLGYLSTTAEAGQYSAANRIPGAVLTFSGAWTSVVYPHSAELAATDRPKLRMQAGTLISATVMVALPFAVCTPFVAHGLMVAAFGSQFGPAGTTFALCTVGLALALIDITLGTLVLALGGDRRAAFAMTVTALFNIALNIPVIPLFGRNGAAIDSIASEALMFAILMRTTSSLLGGLTVEWGRIARIALALVPAVVALVIVPADQASVWLRIALGTAAYAAGTVLFGAVRVQEVRDVLSPRMARAAPGSTGGA